jgi:hypothetical protein
MVVFRPSGEPHRSFLNVKKRVGRRTLRVDVLFLRYRETLPPRLLPDEKPPRWETILLMCLMGDPLLTNGYRDKAILPIMERWVAAELNGSVSGRQIPLWNSANLGPYQDNEYSIWTEAADVAVRK